jgi:uncharacterized protein (DUF305 family)
MRSKTLIVASALALSVMGYFAYPYLFMNRTGSMPGMDHSKMNGGDTSEVTKAFETTMAVMMKGMAVPLTGKPDLDFVQGMIPHHKGAIDMAKVVLQYGADPEVKKLAEAVVKAQENEIGFMKDWVTKTDQMALTVVADSTKANSEAMAVMMKNMMVPYSGNADLDFVKGMIPHHQGAVDMAKVAIQFAKDPALLKLASDIISAQEGEISFMNDWLKRNGQ